MAREVVVAGGVRTAIGTFGGSLKDIAPVDMAATVVKEALARAKVEGKDVAQVVFGHVVNTEPRDMYLSRVAAVNGGLLTIDEVCERYSLTLEEFAGWQRAVDRSGMQGLRVTRIQHYRDLYERQLKY